MLRCIELPLTGGISTTIYHCKEDVVVTLKVVLHPVPDHAVGMPLAQVRTIMRGYTLPCGSVHYNLLKALPASKLQPEVATMLSAGRLWFPGVLLDPGDRVPCLQLRPSGSFSETIALGSHVIEPGDLLAGRPRN